MRVLMVPHLEQIQKGVGGINEVIKAYFKYLPDYGVELVSPRASDYDILVSHAGAASEMKYWPTVAMTHGLYWANDYPVTKSHLAINASVIAEVRHAKAVTVPSTWVAKSFQRDMRFTPHIVPHGIDWQSWQHSDPDEGFVLWNKNRPGDACDPNSMLGLATRFPEIPFVTTFTSDVATPNVHKVDVMPHGQMKRLVQKAGVYLSIARETFGIGTLEAMASGVPVLGWDIGGNRDLVRHGVTGYLAEHNNMEDLVAGLNYCLQYRDTLGDHAREAAKQWTWEKVAKQVAGIYESVLGDQEPTVGIVIPSFNYGAKVGRAIESAMEQDYELLTDIIIVDDGSPDDGLTGRVVEEYMAQDSRVRYIRTENAGVAHARNHGVQELNTKYVACLDADDAMEPEFLSSLIPALEDDRGLGIAYSKLMIISPWREPKHGSWPDKFDYDRQVDGHNQIPTCCVFRREMWERLGGYRQRYSPIGCGSEDAEFWLRAGSIGYDARLATTKPLFIYSLGTGYTTGNKDYKEVDWLGWHPWTKDALHPFASVATPKAHSHPARQYDSPVVSVIIPVGPGHESNLIEALDSLEAQTFREWEAIVVDDTDAGDCANCKDEYWVKTIQRSYPYVTFYATLGKQGAGFARNRGAELARAPLLLFLDADDFLKPTCIEEMLNAYSEGPAIIYTDYEAHAEGVDQTTADRKRAQSQLLHYDGNYAVWNGRSLPYEWERAHIQPEDPPYIWNLISSLVPKLWHDEIGGFDERAASWEDWDYWVRLAFRGKPFVRVPLPLVVYLYWTGTRRETGYQLGGELLQYYQSKYKELEKMPCTSCSGQRPTYNPRTDPRRAPTSTVSQATRVSAESTIVPDRDWIKCRYTSRNTGWHNVIGAYVFEQMPVPQGLQKGVQAIRHADGGWMINYGYRSANDVFLVHKEDLNLMSHLFEPLERRVPSAPRAIEMPVETRETPPPPPAPPKRTEFDQLMDDLKDKQPEQVPEQQSAFDDIDDPEYRARAERDAQRATQTKPPASNLSMLPIPPSVIDRLHENGYTMVEQLADWTVDDWQQIHGVGPVRAEGLVEMTKKVLNQ